MCSGKVYYDLLEKRREESIEHVAIMRIERLYPFPKAQLRKACWRPIRTRGEFVWCQEEPQNQGAWFSSQHHLRAALPRPGTAAIRRAAFFRGTGVRLCRLHLQQQHALVAQALGLPVGQTALGAARKQHGN